MIVIFLVLCVFSVRADPTGCSRCKTQRVLGMQSVDCFDTGLREVPQCLKPTIEVLDLSYNRIRKIKRNDLDRYSNLRYLYLTDNMITDIEEEALSGKTTLEILDISYNSFSSIPKIIFQLPSLSRLYLSQNHNTNIADEIEKSKPILSPLIKLDIGYNEFRELPNLGDVPTLIHYNISGNQNVLVKASHFSGLCMLKTLVNQNFSAVFENPCDCPNIEMWLLKRGVTLVDSFNCEHIDCPYEIPQEELEIYEKCLESHQAEVVHRSLLTIALPACLIVLAIVCIIILYVYRRKVNKKNREAKTQCKVTRPLYEDSW